MRACVRFSVAIRFFRFSKTVERLDGIHADAPVDARCDGRDTVREGRVAGAPRGRGRGRYRAFPFAARIDRAARDSRSLATGCPAPLRTFRISAATRASSGVRSVCALPALPARPLRPMRCTYASPLVGQSKLITQRTSLMSRPRCATSVAMSSGWWPCLNSCSTQSRSSCVGSSTAARQLVQRSEVG